jgi:hypothetical protein
MATTTAVPASPAARTIVRREVQDAGARPLPPTRRRPPRAAPSGSGRPAADRAGAPRRGVSSQRPGSGGALREADLFGQLLEPSVVIAPLAAGLLDLAQRGNGVGGVVEQGRERRLRAAGKPLAPHEALSARRRVASGVPAGRSERPSRRPRPVVAPVPVTASGTSVCRSRISCQASARGADDAAANTAANTASSLKCQRAGHRSSESSSSAAPRRGPSPRPLPHWSAAASPVGVRRGRGPPPAPRKSRLVGNFSRG